MVLSGQSQPMTSSSSAAAIQRPMPTNSNVINEAPYIVVVNRPGGGGCACSVPPDTTQAVKSTRWSSIAIIITHTIALLAFGFFNWAQWFASLIGIIMGAILISNFNKLCYTTAAVLFSIAVLFDLIAATIWLAYGVSSLVILPTLGAIACLLGAISGFMATCNWDQSGAADVKPTRNALMQVSLAAAARSTQTATVGPPPANNERG